MVTAKKGQEQPHRLGCDTPDHLICDGRVFDDVMHIRGTNKPRRLQRVLWFSGPQPTLKATSIGDILVTVCIPEGAPQKTCTNSYCAIPTLLAHTFKVLPEFIAGCKSNVHSVQALEKHRPIKSLYMRYSNLCDSQDDISLLQHVSRFFIQKMKRRGAPRQLRRFALSFAQNFREKKRDILWLLRTSNTPASRPLRVDLGSELPTLDTSFNTTFQQTHALLTATPNRAPSTPTIVSENSNRDRLSLPRRATLCGPLFASTLQPGLGSPMRSRISDPRLDPPLTPVGQIIRTPSHPPRIAKGGPRTPSRDQWFPAGEGPLSLDLGHTSSSDTCSPEEPLYHVDQLNGGLAFRGRLCVRRLSYPHFHIASSSSHPFSSPLKMSGITNALNTSHELASPLNIRSSSSIATPFTPQLVKDGGNHLQWSPHCLGCFA